MLIKRFVNHVFLLIGKNEKLLGGGGGGGGGARPGRPGGEPLLVPGYYCGE